MEHAMSLADYFVRTQLTNAKRLLKEGNTHDAYFDFSVGLHALQDATAPSHAGFQPWSDDLSIYDKILHIDVEMSYPGTDSNLQSVTNRYLNWFENSNEPLDNINLFYTINCD